MNPINLQGVSFSNFSPCFEGETSWNMYSKPIYSSPGSPCEPTHILQDSLVLSVKVQEGFTPRKTDLQRRADSLLHQVKISYFVIRDPCHVIHSYQSYLMALFEDVSLGLVA